MATNQRQARIEDSFLNQMKKDARKEERRIKRRRDAKVRTRWADEGQFTTLAAKFEEARSK